MARGIKLSQEQIQEALDEKTNGLYTYIPDERFPYNSERSPIILRNNNTNKYIVRTLYYLRYGKKD